MNDDIKGTTNSDQDINDRHRVRMARKKEVVDAKIKDAQRVTGVIVINTGNGKGKSSSGFGMAIRAMGHGMKVGIVQFIKGAMSTGEEQFLRRFPDEVSFHAMGEGYTGKPKTASATLKKAEAAWAKGRQFLSDPTIGLVVFDELNIALKYHYLDVQKK
ncbi:cob(I)yrinic acid a,c-diamide adenosyltransferase [Undibacterium arcticum]